MSQTRRLAAILLHPTSAHSRRLRKAGMQEE
jgi:hypothetical protein